ncbi:MAG: glycosyltransferase [Cyclobacteriaceae bacterium]|nr:glycosyltransferase [Cyclobacteriaceae bacterium]
MGSSSTYLAFDRYPSSKGSGTHINHMTEVLSKMHSPCLLLTLKGTSKLEQTGIIHREFDQLEANYLRRGQLFASWASGQLAKENNLKLGHFRDIWGGLAVLEHPHISPVFEVNGLPSVELPYRYPGISSHTLDKIRVLESLCLKNSELIIVPSAVIRTHLVNRGVPDDKIRIITNGADMPAVFPRDTSLPEKYGVYFGALQSWQGITTLFKALTYLEDVPDFHLVICSSQKEKQVRPYLKLLNKLGVQDKVIWKYQLGKQELNRVLQHAYCSFAPLQECSRNIEQGCSPLKIFESMASGVPVVASDLPVTREIMRHEHEGILVPPDRPAEISRAVRFLIDFKEERNNMGIRAREKIRTGFLWEKKKNELKQVYLSLDKVAIV